MALSIISYFFQVENGLGWFPPHLQFFLSVQHCDHVCNSSISSPGDPYNALQQLTYFGVVFLLGPFMIASGAAMSPALGARFPKYPRIFGGRQAARSLHFLGLLSFLLFIAIHIAMVTLERFPENLCNIVFGSAEGVSIATAAGLFAFYIITIVIIHLWATSVSLRNPRFVQRIGQSDWAYKTAIIWTYYFETKLFCLWNFSIFPC